MIELNSLKQIHNKNAATQQFLLTKTQYQQLQALGLMISASERLGFVDLGTKGLFSGLVCLQIRFMCSMGWSICGTIETLGLIQQYQTDTSAKINKPNLRGWCQN